MKGYYRNILIALAAVMVVCACSKHQGPAETGPSIMLSASSNGFTKALLDASGFAANGNQLQVYDFYTPANSSESTIYINNCIKSDGQDAWPFVDGNSYNWTEGGKHKFFGWLHTDANVTPNQTAGNFFGSGFQFNQSAQTLSIPTVTMGQNTDQFDFMYSSINVRDLDTQPDFSPVHLEYSHLFTAFSIAAKNVSPHNSYKILSIELEGFVNTNSATVDFSGDETVVKYETGNNDNPNVSDYEFVIPEGKQLLGSEFMDVSSFSTEQNNRQYFLTWPMSASEARKVAMTIKYQVKVKDEDEYVTHTQTVFFSANEWVAGKKNNINLIFKEKEISLICNVVDWYVKDEEIDFTDQVVITGILEWDESTVRSVNYETGEVILYDDENIQATCTFRLESPKGATWTASLIHVDGSIDAFEFVEDTKYGAVGTPSTLKLVVTNEAPIAPKHVCKLRITVQTSDMRTIVVRNLVPSGATYEEFTIIQNIING